ncbi:MAG: dinitrogenase iron-molybdenum cofactor biosynthesis protein [Desulfobacteria bacterium]
MMEKILITIYEEDVAPRFDLSSEVFIASLNDKREIIERKTIVLTSASPEELCHMILSQGITHLICGGIEDEFYQYLNWKKLEIIDSVIGHYQEVLDLFLKGSLEQGTNLMFQKSQG